MRQLLALTAALILSAPACACSQAVSPITAVPSGGVDMATARKIEAKVRLPDGAKPLSTYARFYYIDRYTPDGMVSGWYVGADGPSSMPWPKAGIHLEKPNVGVADGGCFVIRLTYDPARDQITEIRCNGHA